MSYLFGIGMYSWDSLVYMQTRIVVQAYIWNDEMEWTTPFELLWSLINILIFVQGALLIGFITYTQQDIYEAQALA